MLAKHSQEFKNTMIGNTGCNHTSGRTMAVGTGGKPVGQAGSHGLRKAPKAEKSTMMRKKEEMDKNMKPRVSTTPLDQSATPVMA